jgi:hypothetical protein
MSHGAKSHGFLSRKGLCTLAMVAGSVMGASHLQAGEGSRNKYQPAAVKTVVVARPVTQGAPEFSSIKTADTKGGEKTAFWGCYPRPICASPCYRPVYYAQPACSTGCGTPYYGGCGGGYGGFGAGYGGGYGGYGAGYGVPAYGGAYGGAVYGGGMYGSPGFGGGAYGGGVYGGGIYGGGMYGGGVYSGAIYGGAGYGLPGYGAQPVVNQPFGNQPYGAAVGPVGGGVLDPFASGVPVSNQGYFGGAHPAFDSPYYP